MLDKNKRYHLEMILNELKSKDFIKDTRGYLSLDTYEQKLILILILQELIKYDN